MIKFNNPKFVGNIPNINKLSNFSFLNFINKCFDFWAQEFFKQLKTQSTFKN